MDFLIVNKKSGFRKEMLDYCHLNSAEAPTKKSLSVASREYAHFAVFVYPHHGIRQDLEARDFFLSDQKSLVVNGYVHFADGGLRNSALTDFVAEIDSGRDLEGDFQVVKISSEGNGYILGSDIGWRQLYRYKDDHCEVLASSIKLIVDSVKNIHRSTFGDNFDYHYTQDSIFSGWHNRNHVRKTAFRQIEKIYPHDRVSFKNGQVLVYPQDKIVIPDHLCQDYHNNEEQFFSMMIDRCSQFVRNVWSFDLDSNRPVSLALTGGLDSRATLALFYPMIRQKRFEFQTSTSGQPNHPDVQIAKRIASALNLRHTNRRNINEFPAADNIFDYQTNYYLSEGNWDSSTFVPRSRILSDLSNSEETPIRLLGADSFKRDCMRLVYSNNRWFSARAVNNNPFAFPALGIKCIGYLGLLSNNQSENHRAGTNFVYHLLKKQTPELLDIPFAGQFLPAHYVKPYSTVKVAKSHKRASAFWDRDLILKTLSAHLTRAFEAEFDSALTAPTYKTKLKEKLSDRFPTFIGEALERIRDYFPEPLQRAENRLLKKAAYYQMLFSPSRQQRSMLMDMATVSDCHTFSEITNQ